MGKFISNLFLGALAIGLSIFTGSRTLDLLAWALPAGQEVYQWLGLAAFEGGMYFWSFYFISGAKGTPQRSISLVMAVFSVVAVCVATIADMSLDAGQAGKIAPMPAAAQQSMIIFVGITVALNVAAFLACKLMSIEKLREIAEGQAEDHIYGEGLRAIKAISPSIASAAAPHLAQEWANRTWDKIVPGMHGRTEFPTLAAPASASAFDRPAPQNGEGYAYQCVGCKKWTGNGHLHVLADGNAVFYCESCASQLAPAPVAASAPAKQPGRMARAASRVRGFLGRGSGKQEAVTLSQTATVPTRKQLAPASLASRPVRRPAPASSVAAARHARRAARYQRPPVAPAPAPVEASGPAPVEHRTCSECPTIFEVKNAKQLTCSPACRSKRSRRLAGEKKARA